MISFKRVNALNLNDFKLFYDQLDSKTIDSFRYFESRGLNHVNSVAYPFLCYIEGNLAGYCHLDLDDEERVWFGIVISPEFRGRGLSIILTEQMLSLARSKSFKSVYLSVDKTNMPAIKSYRRSGFVVFAENNKSYFMSNTFKKQ